jgi:para-nitrobenzyl esterase
MISSARADVPSGPREVQVDGGRIAGITTGSGMVRAYLGVPYAAAPVNDLRWRPPQPVAKWPGTRSMDRFGPMCLQRLDYRDSMYFQGDHPTAEDCLTLNIWEPARTGREKLPVMVWIHPGGFTQQAGSLPLYDGSNLAKKGVIVVTFNYRLGLLGFLALPDLTGESQNHASGDYGLMDQVAVLEWIKRNIAAFGGDAENVTLFGQGSGAVSIAYLAASPVAHGLFTRAIAESGGAFGGDMKPPRTQAESEAAGQTLMRTLHVETLAQMRNLPGDLLVDAKSDIAPTIDGWLVTHPVSAAQDISQSNTGSVMVGSNGDEASRFQPILPASKFIEEVHRRYGEHADAFLSIYPAGSNEEAASSFYASGRDITYGWQAWTWAKLHTQTGEQPAYLYVFRHPPPFAAGLGYRERNPASGLGAYHGAEIPYVFDNLDAANQGTIVHPWREADRTLATMMSDYWTNFAKTGNPNGRGLPMWPAFRTGSNDVMIFGDDPRAGPVPYRAGLNFADTIFPPK